MKFRVKVEDQTYEVEIDNHHARPVIAFVDGEPFEVWPEESIPPAAAPAGARPSSAIRPPAPVASQPAGAQTGETVQPRSVTTQPGSQPANGGSLRVMRAPIPGVITSVSVEAGEEVAVGQQLCILEAMKMNNSIRASRAGRIGMVHVTVGQHVKHNDMLVEFAE
jgi:propionyl-CoA carboxylase alpha chain